VRKCELIRLLLVFGALQDDLIISNFDANFVRKAFFHSEWLYCGVRLNYTIFFMKSNPIKKLVV